MTSVAEKAVYAILAASTAVTNLVPTTRITPTRMKQNSALPAISYFRVDGPRVYCMTGPSGYALPRIQVDVWARDYPEAKTIAENVRVALSGYRGVIAGVTVQGIFCLDDHDVVDDQEEILPIEMFHVAMDFRVHHNE